MSVDFSKMKLSELIRFTEEQAEKEQSAVSQQPSDSRASWAETLELLKIMKERGMPESLQDDK